MWEWQLKISCDPLKNEGTLFFWGFFLKELGMSMECNTSKYGRLWCQFTANRNGRLKMTLCGNDNWRSAVNRWKTTERYFFRGFVYGQLRTCMKGVFSNPSGNCIAVPYFIHGGRLSPPNYYLFPRIFISSYGPELRRYCCCCFEAFT